MAGLADAKLTSCYYRTYNNCDYNGTGIQLKANGEVSPTEEELINLIAPAGATLTSKYELIEYVNDVNREYVEVLVEQNINGRTDTTYTYGVDRISKELFNQTNRTSYYLYDPRGSVAGLADAKGHLTKTYQYSPTGELTHGAAAHENEYTYNGESYNPNIQSQYLRARYYSVVTANFLTEDTYLGSINEPLTLNRYNYCISSYPNYMDPSGNLPWRDILQQGTKMGPILPAGGAKLEDTYQAGLDIWNGAKSVARTVKSFGMGVRDSLLKAFIDKPFVSMLPWAALTEKAYSVLHRQDYPNPLLGESLPLYSEWRPTEWLKGQIAANETRIQALTGEIEDRNAYYLGRCGGDVLTGLIGFAESFLGSSMVAFGASTLAAEAASGAGLVLAPGSLAMVVGGVLVAVDGATETAYAVQMLGEDIGRYRGNKAEEAGSKEETGSKENSGAKGSEYKDAIDSLSDNNKHHILQEKHSWDKVVDDPKSWDEVSDVINQVLEFGIESPYKGTTNVFQKVYNIKGSDVLVKYLNVNGKLTISDAWVITR